MTHIWRELTPFERELLGKLLGSTFVGREAIVDQVGSAVARVIDENGSLALRTRSSRKAEVRTRVPVEAEAQDLDGTTIHALLHVLNGSIAELEFYKSDGSRITQMPAVDAWAIV
jgi:hypothetical protein